MHHHEEVLDELVGPCQRWVSIEPSLEILLLKIIEGVLLTDTQPDGRAGRKFLETLILDHGLHLGLLEYLQKPIDGSFRAVVALLFEFTPEGVTIRFSPLAIVRGQRERTGQKDSACAGYFAYLFQKSALMSALPVLFLCYLFIG